MELNRKNEFPLLSMKDCTLSFGEGPVVKNFSLEIARGDKVLLYGPSGSGKSSILKMLLGFVTADSGELLWSGKSLEGDILWEARQNIAYVPQNADIYRGKVRGFFDEVFSYRANRERKREYRAFFEKLHLPSTTAEKEFEDLSGGEKQRVILALVLSLGRKVFFLDEITASLDKELKGRVADMFLGREEFTVLAVSHDPVWRDRPGIKTIEVK